MTMRLPDAAHTAQPWRIHDVTRDFRVEDVWQLPAFDDPDDFPHLVDAIASFDIAHSRSFAVRALVAIRLKLGALFGWDSSGPPAIRGHYLSDDEWAAELANRTMHGSLHVGRVRDANGRWRGQLGILVRPNGLGGELYMAAIRPFRHLIVYPAILGEIDRSWRT